MTTEMNRSLYGRKAMKRDSAGGLTRRAVLKTSLCLHVTLPAPPSFSELP